MNNMARITPKLVVFDLDYTLWPFWVDTHYRPPFRLQGQKIVDSQGHVVKCYPQSTAVLKGLKDLNCDIAVASRTSEIEGAGQLIKLFNWDNYITYREIYPGCKVTHFQQLKKKSNVEFEDMIFFDDENRNIVDVSKLNVTCILVSDGINLKLMEDGLTKFADKRR